MRLKKSNIEETYHVLRFLWKSHPDDAAFCPGCGKQFQKKGPFTIACTYCRASNPDDAMFCWSCGRQLSREENVANLIPPIPSPPLPGGVQPPAGSAPMVQGTPQTSDVPPVLGTPSGLNAPAMGQAGAQGVASSSAQAGAEKAALAHGQAGSQGAAPSVGQAAAPSGQAAAPSAPQTIGKQTTPAQSPSPTQPSHFAAPHGQPAAPSGQPAAPHGQAATSSAPRTFVSHSAAPRMASGGIKVAGHISRRAFMLGVAGGAVAVAAGTGAILYLNRPASGGPSPAGSTSGGATSGRSTPAGPSPVPTVKTYFDAINRKDAQTAWDQLSTNYQSQYGSKEAFFRSVAQGSAYDYTLSLTQEDSSTATVVATQVGGSCSGGQDAVPLVIENGVWKIDGLRIAKPCPQ